MIGLLASGPLCAAMALAKGWLSLLVRAHWSACASAAPSRWPALRGAEIVAAAFG